MAAGLAAFYAVAYPTRGIVFVDAGPELRPFIEVLQQVEPALRGPGFATAGQFFEETLGLELIPEPERSLVLSTHRVSQDVVVGYWETLLRADPAEFQAWLDAQILPELDVPCLGVFGRPLTDGERERFERLPDFQLEEWTGDGHFVHLVDPERFTARLSRFVAHCTSES